MTCISAITLLFCGIEPQKKRSKVWTNWALGTLKRAVFQWIDHSANVQIRS